MLPWSNRLRISNNYFFIFSKQLRISGINLSFDQSPPPITLPALTEAMFGELFYQKDLEYAE